MKKKLGLLALVLTVGMLAGCGSEQTAKSSEEKDAVTGAITVSAAASLTDVLNELAQKFPLPLAAVVLCRHRLKKALL